MYLIDAQRNEIGAALDPDYPLTPNLKFGVTGKSDFFPPLLRSVPQQPIASVQWLACVVDLQSGLHLKRWQVENVSLRDRLFQSLYCVSLLGCIGGTGERRKQD